MAGTIQLNEINREAESAIITTMCKEKEDAKNSYEPTTTIENESMRTEDKPVQEVQDSQEETQTDVNPKQLILLS